MLFWKYLNTNLKLIKVMICLHYLFYWKCLHLVQKLLNAFFSKLYFYTSPKIAWFERSIFHKDGTTKFIIFTCQSIISAESLKLTSNAFYFEIHLWNKIRVKKLFIDQHRLIKMRVFEMSWKNFREIWELRKNFFVRKFEKKYVVL